MVRGVTKSSHPVARPLGASHTCGACETRDPDDCGSWAGFDGPGSGRDKRARLAARAGQALDDALEANAAAVDSAEPA